ncbi:MAG: phage terminase large subunit [Oligoflexia bacterium]|nr:phage terminase large subunit [Oligoflexia bacterium]
MSSVHDPRLDALMKHKNICEKSFSYFFYRSMKILEPQTKIKWNWHLDLVIEYLESLYLGQIKRLIINIPPRNFKSLICNVCFPAWVWTKEPSLRFISSSYVAELSTKHSYDRRQLIESDWYKQLWGDVVRLERDNNQKNYYQNTKRGSMFSTSTNGSVTGHGCNIMIVDDPHDPMEASSDVQRESGIVFWKETLSSRFNDPKNARTLVVMQRLHERDLTGYLLAEENGWTQLKIPIECESRTTFIFPITNKEKNYEPGEILNPEYEGREELDRAKISLGSYGYAAQKQQEPAPREGGMVKREWFKFCDRLPEYFPSIVLSCDMAFKGEADSDYVVMQVWGKKDGNHYLIEQIRKKLTFTETCRALEELAAQYKGYREILIEEKANGAAVIDTLASRVHSMIRINPKDPKVSRLNAVLPMIEAGNVFLPNPLTQPWVDDFILEVCRFPKAVHDDQVDAMTQYLNREKENIGWYPSVEDLDRLSAKSDTSSRYW